MHSHTGAIRSNVLNYTRMRLHTSLLLSWTPTFKGRFRGSPPAAGGSQTLRKRDHALGTCLNLTGTLRSSVSTFPDVAQWVPGT